MSSNHKRICECCGENSGKRRICKSCKDEFPFKMSAKGQPPFNRQKLKYGDAEVWKKFYKGEVKNG